MLIQVLQNVAEKSTPLKEGGGEVGYQKTTFIASFAAAAGMLKTTKKETVKCRKKNAGQFNEVFSLI